MVLASIAGLLAAVSGACGSSSQTVTSPTSDKCAVSASASPSSFAPPGGNGTVSVTTNRECQWSVSPAGNWIHLGGTASGQGDGTVPFTVASNVDPVARTGSISVGTRQLTITQEAAPCTFTVSPASDSVSPSGGRRTIGITASSGQCTWTARSETDWLSIVEGSQGTGSGQVTYEARATTGPPRTGRLVVAGQAVTITQGQGCSIAITPAAQDVGASGGSGSVAVTTADGCPWSAQSNVPWITITSGQSGTGPGNVAFNVGAWDGPNRTGTLTIDGQVFTVTQTAGCSFTIEPTAASIGPGAESGTVTVRTAGGCAWVASSNAPWLSITAGTSGSGEGLVQFSAGANTGPPRSGTLTIAGQTFTVNQAGCTFAIAPSSADVGAAAGTGTFSLTTAAGCTWTATSSAPDWLTIEGASSGSGNATITFRYSENPSGSPARTATISAGGQTFTLRQGAGAVSACTYSISPTEQTGVPYTGGTGSFTMTPSHPSCTWTVASDSGWLTVTSGASGRGPEPVSFAVAANTGAARTGRITAQGQVFSLSQTECAMSLSPESAAVPASETPGSIAVTADGCVWSATTPDAWIQITGGASGTGNGTVTFTVLANPGAPRTGTIVVGTRTFTLTQAAAGG